MNNLPKTNLGQSTFQDTWFVAGAQLTPFRALRQLQLQINEIESSLKKADINKRRTLLKISKLNPDVPEEALDIEELSFDLEGQAQLIADASNRLANFQSLIPTIIGLADQEYWDAGFESAEQNHWVTYFAKQLSISKMTGIPDKQLVEQMMLLPDSMIQDVIKISADQSTRFMIANGATDPKLLG